MASPAFRCGFAAIVGRPNVGKSTLINAIMQRKLSIATPKPQTTRHRILAVHSSAQSQIIFVDTPGLHRDAGKAMNRMMNRTAAAALADADVILHVSEATRWSEEDADVLLRLKNVSAPALALLNKVDLVHPRERVLEAIAAMAARFEFAEIMPISARNRHNIDSLLTALPGYLPESPALFPETMQTDRSREFQAAEIIREKLTLLLRDELPYGLSVQIEKFADEAGGLSLSAVIWVERNSQKGIVIGKGGSMLKRVGTSARVELAGSYNRPVHLELWVRVKDNWANNDADLAQLGYELP